MGAAGSSHVLIGGLSGAGKTTFLYTLLHGESFGETESTGDVANVETIQLRDKPVTLCDLGAAHGFALPPPVAAAAALTPLLVHRVGLTFPF